MRKLILLVTALVVIATKTQAQDWVMEEYLGYWVENGEMHDFSFSINIANDTAINYAWEMTVTGDSLDDLTKYGKGQLNLVALTDSSHTITNFYSPSLTNLGEPIIIWEGKKVKLLNLNLRWANVTKTEVVLELVEEDPADN